jgi:phosphoribosylanthranilate isomerase
MSVFVKICGICHPEDAQAVAQAGPDAMGFVFWPDSRRYVQPEKVAHWPIPPSIKKVGVFADIQTVQDCVARAGLDVVQLHGHESPALCAQLPGLRWKLIHLNESTPAASAAYDVDALLLDNYSEKAPGGTGMPCDWKAAQAFVASCGRPVVLAGGLKPENIRQAIEQVRPWGVDVSSGVEQSPGKKDMQRVKDFIELCRKY